jgi:nitroreductase
MTRRFADTPIAVDAIDALLDLARRAPSAGYSQGVHFLVFAGADRDRFWQTTDAESWFASRQPGVLAAPVIIVPLAEPAAYTTRYAEQDKAGHGLEVATNWPVPFWLTDAAMAVQNLLLLVEDQGLGALYFGIFRNADTLLRESGVPAGVVALGAVAIGHRAADDLPSGSGASRQRRPLDEVVHHGRWQDSHNP